MRSLSLVMGAAESSMSDSVAGPVGLVAVALGLGGLVVGLVRRRKAAVVVSARNQRVPAAEKAPQA